MVHQIDLFLSGDLDLVHRPVPDQREVVGGVGTRASVEVHRGAKRRFGLHLNRAPDAIAIDNSDLAELLWHEAIIGEQRTNIGRSILLLQSTLHHLALKTSIE
jgi:hypothetical protein